MGEIYDEFDRDIASAHHEPDGPWSCPGRSPSMTFPTWGWNSPRDPMPRRPGWSWTSSDTVPTGGEKLLVDGWWLEVVEVDYDAIQRLRLGPGTQPAGASNDR